MATLIKIDRNGSKHWQGRITCDRCGGSGVYYVGCHNGQLVAARPFAGTCYKCNGTGKVTGKWIEHTAEYQAKLDAEYEAKCKAEAEKRAAEQAERERLEKEAEEKRLAEEAARKAISQHVGEIGKRIKVNATYTFGTSWASKYGNQYLFSFKDDNGNVLVWKTSSIPETPNKDGKEVTLVEGGRVELTGTVKEHGEYKDEKQTVLTRCKIMVTGA